SVPAPRRAARWPPPCSAGSRSRRCSACWWSPRSTWSLTASRSGSGGGAERRRHRRRRTRAEGSLSVNITDGSIKNPGFAWMLMASTILFGLVAVLRIGISQYPDVDYPNITVTITWPGAAPTAVEREILDPIEQAIAQVEGVKEIDSSAQQGAGTITA